MIATKAKGYFHGAEGFNCAQAVAKAFEDVTGAATSRVKEFASCGGGRAPNGVCGALYAAKILAPEKADLIEQAFAKVIGHTTCREIRAAKKFTCAQCVEIAAKQLS